MKFHEFGNKNQTTVMLIQGIGTALNSKNVTRHPYFFESV